MSVEDGPRQIGRRGEVFTIDQVANAADAEPKHESECDGVHVALEVVASPVTKGGRDQDAGQQGTPDGDTALGDGEDVAEVVAVEAPVFDDEETAGTDDAGGYADQDEGVEVVFVATAAAGDPHRGLDADEDAEGREEPMPGQEEASDGGDVRTPGDLDREHWHHGYCTSVRGGTRGLRESPMLRRAPAGR